MQIGRAKPLLSFQETKAKQTPTLIFLRIVPEQCKKLKLVCSHLRLNIYFFFLSHLTRPQTSLQVIRSVGLVTDEVIGKQNA